MDLEIKQVTTRPYVSYVLIRESLTNNLQLTSQTLVHNQPFPSMQRFLPPLLRYFGPLEPHFTWSTTFHFCPKKLFWLYSL